MAHTSIETIGTARSGIAIGPHGAQLILKFGECTEVPNLPLFIQKRDRFGAHVFAAARRHHPDRKIRPRTSQHGKSKIPAVVAFEHNLIGLIHVVGRHYAIRPPLRAAAQRRILDDIEQTVYAEAGDDNALGGSAPARRVEADDDALEGDWTNGGARLLQHGPRPQCPLNVLDELALEF
jgi:hypothetical protein